MDITQIPDDELKHDRAESVLDAKVCEIALIQGIETYSGGESVQHRLDVNRAIIKKIDAELARRYPMETHVYSY